MSRFFERAFVGSDTVRLVEEDPQLFADLPPRARRDAYRLAVAPALQLRRGPRDGTVPGARDATRYLGLLVLEGTLIRNVRVARQPRSELVGRDGVTIPLRLTHEVIAQIVGAQRPTVSTALHALSREGLLTRRSDHTWLLDPRSRHHGDQGPILLTRSPSVSVRSATTAAPT